MNVHCLGSSSAGNAYVLHDYSGVCIAIDCGIPIRQMEAMLAEVGIVIDDLSALFISHEHVDHVRSLASLQRRGIRVYMTSGTARALRLNTPVEVLQHWKPVSVGGMSITPLPVGHDAAEPCSFVVKSLSGKVAIVTDLGAVDDQLLDPLSGCDLVVIEANHDETMLFNGPYPFFLKQRVASLRGHLSNEHSGAFLSRLCRECGAPTSVWLAHLSEQNNEPALAVATVRKHLHNAGFDIPLLALPRHGKRVSWMSGWRSEPVEMTKGLK